MAQLITLTTKSDARGSLTVLEKCLPFTIKRIFNIYNVPQGTTRGGHGHKKTKMALICLAGSCEIHWQTPEDNHELILNSPEQCLILEPGDWHQMKFLSKNTILSVLASEDYDADDYIFEAYR